MSLLVFASSNKNKFAEVQKLFESFSKRSFDLRQQLAFNLTTPPETGNTFLENALIKAHYAYERVNVPVIAEDSGLEVEALEGEPGVYSSRYAGERASDNENVDKLLNEMKDLPDTQRSARFCCSVVYICNNRTINFDGYWEGKIAFKRQGTEGFGYDPIFFLPNKGCTSAKLSIDEKNNLSHRAKAFKLLIKYLNSNKE